MNLIRIASITTIITQVEKEGVNINDAEGKRVAKTGVTRLCLSYPHHKLEMATAAPGIKIGHYTIPLISP